MRATNTSKAMSLLRLLLVASLVLVGASGQSLIAHSASASVTNTRVDAQGTVELTGAGWLGGNGVDVYSNGNSANNDAGRNNVNGIYVGQKWQCVELVNRLYVARGWITGTWWGNGNQLYANAPANLTKQPNGSISYLSAGDVVALDDGNFGHVGIVNSVSGTSVQIVNQNTSAVYSTATWSGGRLTMGGWAGYSVQGVVHRPVGGQSGGGSTGLGTPRIGILNNGQLAIKEGPINATWTTVGGGTSFKLSPNRIAVYDGTRLAVKEGPINATWTTVAGQVTSYEVVDNRIGIMVGGQVSVKDGSIGATWTAVGGGTSFKMSPNRIALYSNGQLLIKEGPINAQWVAVTGNVDAYEVTDNRIAVLAGGQLYVKDGAIGATWTAVGGGTSFKMSPNRIALYSNGQLLIKEGPINAQWVAVTGNVTSYDVTDTRVGVSIGGQVSVKDGPLNATWTPVGSGQTFDMS